MNNAALHDYLHRERKFAALSFLLDEELGVHHGISSSDFVLLRALHEAAAPAEEAGLARQLSLRRSQLLMRLRPLEKVGLAQRTADSRGGKQVGITPSGNRLVREASETAAYVCERWVAADL